jgi:CDP-diacylglycerol pyrophosphatase
MPITPSKRWRAIACVVFFALLAQASAARAGPNALWKIVHGQCVPDWLKHRVLKSPCVAVNLRIGSVVIKDRRGQTQFLLLPIKRIAGIESRALLATHAANYFADAWLERSLVEKRLGHAMPRDTLSLAVNSALSRTQNQLHIHIDCIRPDVRDALSQEAAKIGSRWAPFDIWLFGHHYSAMRITGATLAGHNPFKLLARGIPGAAADMGYYTLVVVGMTFAGRPGFVALEDHADPAHGDNAGGEELQDHACVLGRDS